MFCSKRGANGNAKSLTISSNKVICGSVKKPDEKKIKRTSKHWQN